VKYVIVYASQRNLKPSNYANDIIKITILLYARFKDNYIIIFIMDKEQLLSSVKGWISLDDEIKTLNRALKEKRTKKRELTEALVSTMKSNEIDCFDLSGGSKLIYTKSKGKKALSKKHLLSALSKYFKGNKDDAKSLSKFILDSREDNIKENIRRKLPK